MTDHPLPRRVRHKDGETALSLALRLSERDGSGWKRFARAAGLERSGLRMSLALDRLSSLSSVPVERLSRWTPIWFGHEMDVLGHRLDRSRFLRLNLRVCPLCMAEDVEDRAAGERAEDAAHLRLEWCMAFVFGCGRHGVRLVTRCSACDARPRWDVGRIDQCHCGSSLLAVVPEPLPADEREVLGTLLDRLHGRPETSSLLAAAIDVPLADLVNLLRLLGEVAIARPPTDARACALEVDDLGGLLARGAAIISGMPGSFEELLDRLAGTGDVSGRASNDVYGLPLMRWMRSDRPFVDVLRPVVEGHGKRLALTMRRPADKCRRELERQRQILTAGQMDRLRRAVGWNGSSPARRDEVLEQARPENGVMLTREAAEHLGVPWRCFERLRMGGAVEPCWEGGLKFYYRSELDALLAELRSGVPTYRSSPVGLCSLARLAKLRKRHVANMILDVLRGEMRCVGALWGVREVSGLLFRPDDVPLTVRRHPLGSIPCGRVDALLQLNPWIRIAAADAGLLPMRRTGGPRSAGHCEPDAVLAFDRKFVSLSRIARCLGENTRRMRGRMTEAGVDCRLQGPSGGIYLRADVEKVLGTNAVPLVVPEVG